MAKTAAAVTEDPRGLKRICLSCSTRFYDLNKRPITCPNCDVEYTGDYSAQSITGTAAKDTAKAEAAKAKKAKTTEATEEDDDDAVVSLTDLEDDENEDESDNNTDPDLEALKEIGEDVDDVNLDDSDDIDATLEDEDDK